MQVILKFILASLSVLLVLQSFSLGFTVQSNSSVKLYAAPSQESRVLSQVPSGSRMKVISESPNKQFWGVAIFIKSLKSKAVAYVGKGQVSVLESLKAPLKVKSHPRIQPQTQQKQLETPLISPVQLKSKDNWEEIYRRWGLGFQFTGYQVNGETRTTASAELRYFWTRHTQTLLGLGYTFVGKYEFLGYKLAQRFYLPVWRIAPFVHLGLQQEQFSEIKSGALSAGGGIQVHYSSSTYFEFFAIYLLKEIFDDQQENVLLFGASSGIKF